MRALGIWGLAAILAFAVSAADAQYDPSAPPGAWSDAAGEFRRPAFRYDAPALTPLTVTIPNVSTAGPVIARDPRIDALSAALDHDVDRIYEYVRNHILTTPAFGLSKGAFGTMLDAAGTPFDQAHLMVDLLNAADTAASRGYNARYVYGTLTLNQTDFAQTFGPTSPRGACELLAAGGIPATVNGTSNACSSYSASAGSFTVQMHHVWVRANIGGTNYFFDPSIKHHQRSGPNAGVIAAVPAGQSLQSPTVSQTSEQPTVTQYAGYNPAGLRTALTGSAAGVRNAIAAQEAGSASTNVPGVSSVAVNNALSMQQVTGGVTGIVRQPFYHANQAQRLTSLPGHASIHVLTRIPQSLRTFVHFYVHGGDPAFNPLVVSRLAADIAGRRVMVVAENAGAFDDPEKVIVSLLLDESVMQLPGGAPATAQVNSGEGYTGSPLIVRVAVHHPYHGSTSAAHGMARTQYRFDVTNAMPSLILLGLGERGNGAELRNTRAVSGAGVIQWDIYTPCYIPPGQQECVLQDPWFYERGSQTNAIVAAGESFLTNASRLLDVYEGLAGGRRVTHHVVGTAAVSIDLNTIMTQSPPPGGPYFNLQIGGTQLTLNVAGRMGYAGFTSAARNRQTFAFATASALSTLEQTVLRSQTDAPSPNGTAAMFNWFLNASPAQAYAPSAGSMYQIRFLQIPDMDQASVRLAASGMTWPAPPQQFPHVFTDYDSFTIVAPQSRNIGPMRRSFRVQGEYNTSVSCSGPCTIDDYDVPGASPRYAGFFAYRVNSDGIEIAPVAGSRLKGGSGANFPDSIESPRAERDALDEAYETWATRFDVDLRTGGLTLTPPPDLTTGAGGHPYSLAFQRTYNSDRNSDGPLGRGWTHNFDVRMSTGTDIGGALGEHSPRHALATIIAAEATLSLFAASQNLSRDAITAMLIQNWWADEVFDNQATIARGAGSERFLRQPDGVWQPEPGATATLTRTGTRAAEVNQSVPRAEDPLYRVVTEAFNRSGWSFTYTSGEGVQETFTYGQDLTVSSSSPEFVTGYQTWAPNQGTVTNPIGSGTTFLRRSTVHPFGVTVNYQYSVFQNSYGVSGERLDRVFTNAPFSRSIWFEYAPTTQTPGFYYPPDTDDPGTWSTAEPFGRPPLFRLTAVRSEQSSRRAEFGLNGDGLPVSVTDLMGAVTSYVYQPISVDHPGGGWMFVNGAHRPEHRLTQIRLPHDPSNAFLSFGYDLQGRVSTVTNRRNRTWHYFAGEHARGMSRDPDSWMSRAFHDRQGRQFAATNQRGRIDETEYDGAGRAIRTLTGYASHNPAQRYQISQTWYDAFHNPVLQRQFTRTNSSGSHMSGTPIDAVTEYGYSASVGGVTVFRGLPTRSIDPRGAATRYCYHSAQANCSGVQGGTHNGLLRATFGPLGEDARSQYDSLGRVTQSTVKVTSTETRTTTRTYHASNGLPNRVRIVNPSGPDLDTFFVWDATGNLSTVTDPAGRRARGAYRNDRRLTQLTGADQDAAAASVTRFRYDASHRLQYADRARTVTGSPGNFSGSDWATTEVQYTNWGRVDRIIDPAGDINRFGYRDNDLLRNVWDGEDRQTRYDHMSDGSVHCTRVAMQAPAERRVQRRTDNDFRGQPVRWWTGNHIDPADSCANAARNMGYVSQTIFDNWYRETGHLFPDGTQITGVLDPAGNPLSRTTRAGQAQSFVHDASNRLTSETFPEGTNTYVYNLAGERVSASWTGSGYSAGVTYTYDFAGRLIEERRTQDNRATGYEYDASGARTAIRWPDGWTARYAYDGAGRLTLVCEDADGNPGTGSAGGVAGCEQILAAYTYDRLGRRTQTRFHGAIGAGTSGVSYTYTANSRLVRLDHQFNAASDVTFAHAYDGSGRLTATHTSQNGWLWSAGGTAFTRSYANNFSAGAQYDLDQVEGFTTTGGLSNSMAYLYDANGNRSNTPWSLYIHDSRNRLTTIGSWVQSGGGWNPPATGTWSSWSMRYDPDGRRIQLTSTLSDNLDFVHAGDMEIADILSSNGRITRRYVPGASIDERVAMIVTTGAACSPVCPTAHREYYHNDRQGNVIAMAHQNGTRTAQYVYTPFGVEEPYSASGQPFRYTGQRRDGETGLYYYRARYYDPALGRFLQTDPVLYADQMNLYAYVGNNPLNATDPTGMVTQEWVYVQSTGSTEHHQPPEGTPPVDSTLVGNEQWASNEGSIVTTGQGVDVSRDGEMRADAGWTVKQVNVGYSGRGEGLNNPAMESVPNTGPIPQGAYNLGDTYNSPNVGPAAIIIDAADGNDAHGRTAFRIHGDNSRGNQSASEGCIIAPRGVRDQITASPDRRLRVVAE